MMKFINLTPHQITIRCGDGRDCDVPPSGTVARVTVSQKQIGTLDGIPVVANDYGDPTGVPDPKDGTIYIVSSLVKSRLNSRDDVVAPDTGATAIRDAEGHIVAVTRLVGRM